eukprot:scaffold136005_cov23-Tisochrysis_lutea.AAC.2
MPACAAALRILRRLMGAGLHQVKAYCPGTPCGQWGSPLPSVLCLQFDDDDDARGMVHSKVPHWCKEQWTHMAAALYMADTHAHTHACTYPPPPHTYTRAHARTTP